MLRRGAIIGGQGSDTVPDAPTITGITPDINQLSVAFTAPVSDGGRDITNYEYSTNDGSTWTTVSPSQTSSPIIITGLVNGVTYTVKLRAVNMEGYGAESSSDTGTPRTVPSAPTVTSVSTGVGELTVSFNAPASNGGAAISDYKYSTDGGTYVSSGSTVSPIVITGLSNGVQYYVSLRAVNAAGDGAISNQVTESTASVPGTPGTPTVTNTGDTEVSLSWSSAVQNGAAITDYGVRYSSNSGSTWSSPVSVGPVTSATITSLTNGSSYIFQVRATNAVGNGSYSASSTPAVTPFGVPATPTAPSVTGGNAQVDVSWSAPSANGSTITSYHVQKTEDNGSNWSNAGTTTAPTTSLTVTGLTNGTEYKFRIAAQNARGLGSYSSASSGVTPSTVPSQMTAPVPTAGERAVSLAFTAPSTGGSAITSYTIQYSSNGGSSWSTFGTSLYTSPVSITSLTNGTTYIFRMLATNTNGAGAYSVASGSATPFVPPVSNVAATTPTASAGSTTSAQTFSTSISWTASTSANLHATQPYVIYLNNVSNGTDTASPYSISGLSENTEYTVTVYAKDTNSTLSAGVSVTFTTANGLPYFTSLPSISTDNVNSTNYPNLYVSSSSVTRTIDYSVDPANLSDFASMTIRLYRVSNGAILRTATYTTTSSVSGTWTLTSSELPSAGNSGTYYIWATVVDDDASSRTVNTSGTPLTVYGPEAETYDSDDSALEDIAGSNPNSLPTTFTATNQETEWTRANWSQSAVGNVGATGYQKPIGIGTLDGGPANAFDNNSGTSWSVSGVSSAYYCEVYGTCQISENSIGGIIPLLSGRTYAPNSEYMPAGRQAFTGGRITGWRTRHTFRTFNYAFIYDDVADEFVGNGGTFGDTNLNSHDSQPYEDVLESSSADIPSVDGVTWNTQWNVTQALTRGEAFGIKYYQWNNSLVQRGSISNLCAITDIQFKFDCDYEYTKQVTVYR